METTRLNKYLAACGVCSRRDADKLIEEGVVLVNGVTARAGVKVSAADTVTVRGKTVHAPQGNVVLAYYKPKGVVCTERDAHAERIVTKEIGYSRRVTYAGRLDKDSEGLLLLTDDGALIEAMMRGRHGHEKEYIVKSDRKWSDAAIANMQAGVYLAELSQATRPCKIERIGDRTLKMTLTQGLNRQIRRMCKTQGYEVTSLKRTRVINIELGTLKPGEYRELTDTEKSELYRLCGMEPT
ncbi:MAG: pseudouridine synthase [Bacteroidales bacterium]|nr:pseudouridine synthase [Bacteroidales bacterium]MCM1414299.1 pseudouridine synthase [bacterium]MCM1422179.1 pseudouridine synthase [bacterium]